MRTSAICLLLVGATLPGNVTAQKKNGTKDQELLKGTWKWLINKNLSITTTFEGKVVKLSGDGEVVSSVGEVQFDESVTPKRMDLKLKSRKNPDADFEEYKGIYELHGDTLILCIGKERPTDFFLDLVGFPDLRDGFTLVLRRQRVKGE